MELEDLDCQISYRRSSTASEMDYGVGVNDEEKTEQLIVRNFFWIGLNKDIRIIM